jgi:hypothetical protein
LSDPKIFFARSTAAEETDAAPIPSPVSLRTRPPTPSAVWKRRFSVGPTTGASPPAVSRATAYASRTCPWICGSPRIIESSPEETRKRCSAAARSRCR